MLGEKVEVSWVFALFEDVIKRYDGCTEVVLNWLAQFLILD